MLNNGKRVTDARTWWRQRRPEIVEDFDREVYGRVPKHTPRVKWEVVSTTKEMNGNVPVITRQLLGHVDNSSYPLIKVDIQLNLTTPANATGPVPVMMEFGFSFAPRPVGPRPGGPAPCGAPPRPVAPPSGGDTPLPENASRPGGGVGGGFGPGKGPTWQQQVLAKGWGYAIITPTSVQADNGAGLTKGIIGLCNKGQPRKPNDWGALRAWAWGASRYLKTSPLPATTP